jgi:hypothetical protein
MLSARKNLFWSAKGRSLVKKPNASHTVIGNNAALVSLLLYLGDSRKRFAGYAEEVTLLKPPFWLDMAADEHLSNPWGQQLSDYPPNIQRLFRNLVPMEYLEHITWEVYRLFLKNCVNALKALGVTVIELKENPRLYFLRNSETLKLLCDSQDLGKQHFRRVEDFHIYEWYRKPISAEVRLASSEIVKVGSEELELGFARGSYWPDIYEWSSNSAYLFDSIALFGTPEELTRLFEDKKVMTQDLATKFAIIVIVLDPKASDKIKKFIAPSGSSFQFKMITMSDFVTQHPRFSRHDISEHYFLEQTQAFAEWGVQTVSLCLHAGHPPVFYPPAHVHLYSKGIEDIRTNPVIIFGDGESSIWAFYHFKDARILRFIGPYPRKDVFKNLLSSPLSPHYQTIGVNRGDFSSLFYTYEHLEEFVDQHKSPRVSCRDPSQSTHASSHVLF